MENITELPYRNVLAVELVAAYIRVSTQEQKMHGISLDAQVEKLTEYAEKNNMKIVEWYKDEGVSARKEIKKRPELQRMIQDAQKGRFTRIIFIKLDRFFRSVAEYHECMKLIDPVIWTATEEKYDLSTANGRAFVNMKITIAELEADTAGERIRIVNDYKVKSGMPLYGDQSLPFCFTVAPAPDGSKHKCIAKQNAEVMEDAIAHVMVNHSVSAALGYIKSKHNTDIGYNALMNALRNEMLCGSYKGNPNYCPAYITREMFDKLQTIVERTPRTSTTEHSYVFSGLVRCPGCGSKLTGTPHVVRKKSGKQYTYYGYRCNRCRRDKSCDFRMMIFENTLEQKMLDGIEALLDKQEIESVEIREAAEKRISTVDVQELQAELDRLNYSWQKGRIKTVEEYDRKYDKLVAQIEEAHQEHAEIAQGPDFDKIRATLTGGWKEIYAALDEDHKRAFWRTFVDEITLNWSKHTKDIESVKFF